MSEHLTAEIDCKNCGTPLLLRCAFATNAGVMHELGCPECQATADVAEVIGGLQNAFAPHKLAVVALERRTEIGIGARTLPHVGEPLGMHAADSSYVW